MAWEPNTPTGDTQSPSGSISYILDNWEWIQNSLSAEHTFPGTYGEDAGIHKPGECGIVKYDTYTNIDAIDDVEGALAFATDASTAHGFWVNEGTGWSQAGPFEPGTLVLFYMSAAPSGGWTIVDTYDDYLVKPASASGGSTSGSWNLDGWTVSHTHTYSTVIQHRHSFYYGFGVYSNRLVRRVGTITGTENIDYTGTSGNLNTGSTTMTITGDGTWRPYYVCVIVCSKD